MGVGKANHGKEGAEKVADSHVAVGADAGENCVHGDIIACCGGDFGFLRRCFEEKLELWSKSEVAFGQNFRVAGNGFCGFLQGDFY